MKSDRVVIFAIAIILGWPFISFGQSFPTKPIRLIVPFAVGGGNDLIARQVGQKMSENLHQQIVTDNRGGAGGRIGMEMAAIAAPDGYTIVMGHVGTLAFNPSMQIKPRYDPIKDFTPLSLLVKAPVVMVVHPSVPASSVAQFIALAKLSSNKITYGSGGTGGANHLATEYFRVLTKINLTHVPYKSAGLAATDLIAGNISMTMPAVAVVLPYVKSKRLRAIGVSSEARLKVLSDTPTFAESGVSEFKVSQWYGLLAPSRVPREVIAVLETSIIKALDAEDLRERMNAVGMELGGNGVEEFRQLIALEIKRWAPIVKLIEAKP